MDEGDGVFYDYNADDWGVEIEELRQQIIVRPHENLTIKKTLAVRGVQKFLSAVLQQ